MDCNTYRELIRMGPGVYVPLILASLLITLAQYSVFPLFLAKFRKKPITKQKYYLLCYVVNFFVTALAAAVRGGSYAGPYILWTSVFAVSGLRILRHRGVSEGYPPMSDEAILSVETAASAFPEASPGAGIFPEELAEDGGCGPAPQPILFCRRCGKELAEGSRFCGFCGTAVVERSDWNEMP